LCHRDLDHLLTNLGLLVVPTFLLQSLLPWRAFVVLLATTAMGSSIASLAFTYFVFGPEEPRKLGYGPSTPPRFMNINPVLQCPQAHDLSLCRLGRGMICNTCQREVGPHDRVYRCGPCDFNHCLDCAGARLHPALQFNRFRNAFDEFCFLREAELAIGFDTMLTDRPYITCPDALLNAERLDMTYARELCLPYMAWLQHANRGSMGSSALTSALNAACALWVSELLANGWKHPFLILFTLTAFAQPLDDLLRISSVLSWPQTAPLQETGSSRPARPPVTPGSSNDSDNVGHLAGFTIGGLAYLLVLRQRGSIAPMYPLVPLARAVGRRL